MNKLITSLASLALLTATHSVLAADATSNSTYVASYVKLNVSYQTSNGMIYSNVCGGVFIEEDIVLTASHCINDAWTKAPNKSVKFYYGKNFSQSANLRAGVSWRKFDPTVDLALLRIDRSAKAHIHIPYIQSACPNGPQLKLPSPALVYKRMNDQTQRELAMNTYNTTTTSITSHGKSPLANGQAFKLGVGAVPGDSGSPVFIPTGEIVGIYNGNSGPNGYAATLCAYRNEINTHGQSLQKLK